MTMLQLLFPLIMMISVALGDSVSISGLQGGVNTFTGQRPARQEFSTFKDAGPAFDLYILALQQFTEQDQTDILSYYRVSGIHGKPIESWDGVSGQYNDGYCTHASVLFPSWHRPYLALFEQILWKKAQQIASEYPADKKAKYEAAAQTFRIPYWDWAINPSMPDTVNEPMISINAPSGEANIVNPLYNYTFHPQPSATEFPPTDSLAKYHSTVRYPDSNGKSQPDLSNKQLVANGQALHTLTYQLIAQQSNYAPFSNTGYSDGRHGQYNSLENMHNAIHSLVGNGGHMSIIPYSSFDPIFWLHHANVDRLFAIWQAIYPDSYTTPQVTAYGTYTDAPGSTEDINTPLTPFHSDGSGTLYNSETARTTKHFGYTYAEITDWGVNCTQLAANVRSQLNALYNPKGTIPQRSLHAKRTNNTSMNANGMDHQYFVNIIADKSSLPSSLFLHFFLGPVPSTPATWSYAPTLVATHSLLAASVPLSTPLQTYGQIPLTHSLLPLLNQGIIRDLRPESVILLLTAQLSWRAQDFHDGVVEVGGLVGEGKGALKIGVVGQTVQVRGGEDKFPGYGILVSYAKATEGKIGGAGEGEEM